MEAEWPKWPHRCEQNTPSHVNGPAIELCYENDDGTLWVGNCEYESQVFYCPYCGYKAKLDPPIESNQE